MTPTVRNEASAVVRGVVLSAYAIVLGVLAGMSIYRAGQIRYDFDHFYLDARHIIDQGTINTDDDNPEEKLRRRLQNYLPAATLMFVPFAAMGSWVGGTVWVLLNTVLLIVIVRWIATQFVETASQPWWVGQALPLLLCAGVIYEHARFNQVSVVILFLLLWAYRLLERGRDIGAGMVIAVATIIKLMPGLFLPYLVYRRRWKALGTAVAAILAIDLLGSLVVFGPDRTVSYHKRWWHFVSEEHSALAMIEPVPGSLIHSHFLDHRNQSLAIVLSKAFPGRPLVAKIVYILVMGGCVAVLLTIVRRGPRGSVAGQRITFTMWLLFMLWFTPLLRQYYLIWAYPAIAVLLDRLATHRLTDNGAATVWVALGVWILSMAAWGVDPWTGHFLRTAGVNLWAVLALVIALLVEENRERKATNGNGIRKLSVQAG